MRTSGWVFAAVGALIAVLGLAYLPLSGYEAVGSTLLLGAAALAGTVATYLLVRSRGVRPPPEDRPDAVPGDAAGEVGWFSPGSIWPFAVGAAATVTAAGMAVGTGALVFGLLLVVLATVAFVAEGWRR